jgi:hypothetical protein
MLYRTVLAFLGFLTTSSGVAGPPPDTFLAALSEETIVDGRIEITRDSSPFQFYAVDVYSSMTPIPYRFTGFLDSQLVFDVTETEPNTFGGFATVENPQYFKFVDTLEITLTNPLSGNPMGLDNIVVSDSSLDVLETIDFTGLTGGLPFDVYFQGEFTVTSLFGDWLVSGTYGNPIPFIFFYNPYPVGGSVTGMTPRWVRCQNMSTKQTVVTIGELGTVWNCEAAGLVVSTGDRVRMTVEGTAD